MNRFITLIILLMLSLPTFTGEDSAIYAKKKVGKAESKESIAKRKQRNKKEQRETSKKIQSNAKEVNKKLNELNFVTAEINELNSSVGKLNGSISQLDGQINHLTDSINILDNRLTTMSGKYATAIRKMQTRNSGEKSDFAFIFSANSFSEAYHRSQSLKQFARWRKKKADELVALKADLDGRRQVLETKKAERVQLLDSLNQEIAILTDKKQQSDNLVKQLQREGAQLKKILAQKQREADELDRELNRLIQLEQERIRKEEEAKARKAEEERRRAEKLRQQQEEKEKAAKEKEAAPKQEVSKPAVKPPVQEKPATKKESNPPAKSKTSDIKNFVEAKGMLPYPVKGKVVKHFGRQQHPDLKHVVTDNPGIDIETNSGAEVKSVFSGHVSDIFRLPGYNTIVMVRHGSYLTIYANLGSISVKKGDDVKQGQTIGKVYSDPDDDSRSILHFEVRNERSKENPEEWLK